MKNKMKVNLSIKLDMDANNMFYLPWMACKMLTDKNKYLRVLLKLLKLNILEQVLEPTHDKFVVVLYSPLGWIKVPWVGLV
jgi:hypothetical protein